jgi:hypothetical protein
MSETLTLGAPSISKMDARKDLDKKLGGLKFPLKVRATNHMPFQVIYPWAGKLFLQPSGHPGHQDTVTIARADLLARFVTDVQALADLHGAEKALTIELLSAPAVAAKKPATKTDAAKPE